MATPPASLSSLEQQQQQQQGWQLSPSAATAHTSSDVSPESDIHKERCQGKVTQKDHDFSSEFSDTNLNGHLPRGSSDGMISSRTGGYGGSRPAENGMVLSPTSTDRSRVNASSGSAAFRRALTDDGNATYQQSARATPAESKRHSWAARQQHKIIHEEPAAERPQCGASCKEGSPSINRALSLDSATTCSKSNSTNMPLPPTSCPDQTSASTSPGYIGNGQTSFRQHQEDTTCKPQACNEESTVFRYPLAHQTDSMYDACGSEAELLSRHGSGSLRHDNEDQQSPHKSTCLLAAPSSIGDVPPEDDDDRLSNQQRQHRQIITDQTHMALSHDPRAHSDPIKYITTSPHDQYHHQSHHQSHQDDMLHSRTAQASCGCGSSCCGSPNNVCCFPPAAPTSSSATSSASAQNSSACSNCCAPGRPLHNFCTNLFRRRRCSCKEKSDSEPEDDLLVENDPFRKRCLRAFLNFVYVLLAFIAVIVTYSMIQDLITAMNNPVRSIHYKKLKDYEAPGISMYPGGAKFLACGHYYNNVVTSKVRTSDLDLVNKNCTFTRLNYDDPHYIGVRRDVLVVRGPTSFEKREAIFLHFELEDETRDFFTVSYFVFPGWDAFNASSFPQQIDQLTEYHRYMPTFALSSGLRMWIKLIMSETYLMDDTKHTEFRVEKEEAKHTEFNVEYSVVKFWDRRPEQLRKKHLFFIFFEWKNNIVEQSYLIYTTTPWSIGAGLCGVFLTLHRGYQLAQIGYQRARKDKERRSIRKRTIRELKKAKSMERKDGGSTSGTINRKLKQQLSS